MAQMVGIFRLGRDAEVRYTPSGDAVCNLALVFNFGQKGADGKRPSQWLDASLWGKRAEAMSQYLTKGQQVYCVIADPHIETYQGKNGAGHKLVGRILEIEFAGGNREGGKKPDSETQAPAVKRGDGALDDFTDDIPF